MTPGPVKIAKCVLQSMCSGSLHHRSKIFSLELKALFKNLQYIFKTKEPVLVLNASGSGAMEAALVNSLSPKQNILVIVAGKFGQRWVDIAKSYGIKVHIFSVALGQPVDLKKLTKKINSIKNLSALCMQACETSTASKLPVKDISKILLKHSAKSLLIVDGIAAIGAIDIKQDQWKIDILIGGSQKALAGPAGLSFISFSKKAKKAYLKSKCPKYYWDIQPQLLSYQKNQSVFSSAVHLILAMKTATDFLQAGGLKKQIDRIDQLSTLSKKALDILELKSFSKSPSPVLTAFYVPKTINSQQWLNHLKNKYNIYLIGGQGLLKEKIIRIGHIGDIGSAELYKSFYALAKSLEEKNLLTNKTKQIKNLKLLFSKNVIKAPGLTKK